MQEIWKDVVGYESLYQVSNYGNVRSLNYNHTGKCKNLSIKNHHSGYKFVTLSFDGKHKNKVIHRMVAECFVENPQSKNVVNHIDGNKGNNYYKNLEWVTNSENTLHSINMLGHIPYNGKGKIGSKHHASKPVYQYSVDGLLVKKWDCISDAARFYNVRPGSISNVACGRHKTYIGYIWKHKAE